MTAPLLIELVPKSAHGVNLRSAGTKSQWRAIKELTVRLACGRCEICNAPPIKEHPLETHEVWRWDVATSRQVLVRTIALCWLCHLAKHPGMADKLRLTERMHRHVMRVNGWTGEELVHHTKASLREWVEFSFVRWSFEPDLAAVLADLKAKALVQT
ncbi:hypothetical protein [Scleromatobacter humisilvae]|uniref:HNH endonuclease n=1 Tax=Scleromatobacter humisilvae TaxID=2897159 RepID=A0A9X1YJW9_9BURK|nr:hypothetical protein [Scleromatobacter humisilvae]MCK9687266.1 hypothetical protein [Scleromatobacter humisilvae]